MWTEKRSCVVVLLFHVMVVVCGFSFGVRSRRALPLSSSSTLLHSSSSSSSNSFSVKSSVLDEGLTDEEKTIVRVFRNCGPSVAYVTSTIASRKDNGRRRRRRGDNKSKSKSNNSSIPPGTSLGSGSGFVVESDGYVVTNYHVIQRAYDLNQRTAQWRNMTQPLLSSGVWWNNKNKELSLLPSAQVYVRINSSTQYGRAEVVGVRPELDVAVLRLNSTFAKTTKDYVPLSYGSSADLLVGQRVVAIGNPFGLDQTVTSGVVSALNRQVTGVAGNEIPNCIQTDAAINPGNSGGPLLNSRGELVGVNTMIVTTSGSNAGIGFAVPVDAVQRVANDLIATDRRRRGSGRGPGRWGLSLASDVLTQSMMGNIGVGGVNTTTTTGVLILKVDPNSAAHESGLRPTRVESGVVVERGDVIVAINGNEIRGGLADVQEDFRTRTVGEQIMLTVENGEKGQKRVVYVTLK